MVRPLPKAVYRGAYGWSLLHFSVVWMDFHSTIVLGTALSLILLSMSSVR